VKYSDSGYERNNFADRLSVLVPAASIDCFAWAIRDNHVRFLLRTGATPISIFMSRLLAGYAGWFNRKSKRHGQLFQNPFYVKKLSKGSILTRLC
jgi:hypothetical protein